MINVIENILAWIIARILYVFHKKTKRKKAKNGDLKKIIYISQTNFSMLQKRKVCNIEMIVKPSLRFVIVYNFGPFLGQNMHFCFCELHKKIEIIT